MAVSIRTVDLRGRLGMSPCPPGGEISYRNPIEVDERRLNTNQILNTGERPDQPDTRSPAWYG
jgi:hypothetical protein